MFYTFRLVPSRLQLLTTDTEWRGCSLCHSPLIAKQISTASQVFIAVWQLVVCFDFLFWGVQTTLQNKKKVLNRKKEKNA